MATSRYSRMESDRYSDDYFRQYEKKYEDQTVHTIMDNLAKGGVQQDYASQWAKYYRSQGMNREAQLIEDHVRTKTTDRDREGRGGAAGEAGYGTSECYRCNRIGHFARECPEFTGVRRPGARSRSPPRRDSNRDLRGPPMPRSGSQSGGGGKDREICFRCNGVGHFARECPSFSGQPRGGPSPVGGGGRGGDVGVRRVAHPSAGQAPGTSECYRCNKVGHFARECPSYTGVPHARAFRGSGSRDRDSREVVPYGRGGGGGGRGGAGSDYGTSKCLKCNKYGHFARECREEENLCYKCHKGGHIAKDCSEADLCYVCNQEGHIAKDCPDGNKKTCYRCNGKGHIAPDCPSSQRDIDRVKDRKTSGDNKEGDLALSARDLENI